MPYTVEIRDDGSYHYIKTVITEANLSKERILQELHYWKLKDKTRSAFNKLERIKKKFGEESDEYRKQDAIAQAAIDAEWDYKQEVLDKAGLGAAAAYDIAMDILEGKLPKPK